MSMNTWAVCEYGLYVLPKDLSEYANENGYDIDEVGYEIDFTLYSDADGQAIPLSRSYEPWDVTHEVFYMANLNEYPSLFNKAYNSYEEALLELKEKWGEYLNKDYNYEKNFVNFIGTEF